jgi:FixJ family two-component response regulator
LSRLLRLSGYETRAYRSAGEFLLAERPDAPGCAILEHAHAGPSGMDLHQRLAREKFPLPVIFLTAYGDVATCVRAMKGAGRLLIKPVRREPLLAAVRVALELDAAMQSPAASPHERAAATLRFAYQPERQVLALVVSGRLNKEIAGESAFPSAP